MIQPKLAPTGPDVALHYDELDPFYRGIWGEHVHHGLWLSGKESVEVAVRQLVDIVAAQANVQPGTQVCDVGAGYGGTACQLVKDYGANVTALTISKAQYDYAVARHGRDGNPHFVLGDWLDNDLPDASFDVVTAIECASHMGDMERFFAEAFRVLRPGGRLVFCAWLAGEHPQPWQVRHLLEPICSEGRLPGLGSALEYFTWLEQSAFTIDQFSDLSRSVYRTWPVCLQRIAHKLVSDRRYVQYLFDGRNQNRLFLLTVLRLWLGYRTGDLPRAEAAATRAAAASSAASICVLTSFRRMPAARRSALSTSAICFWILPTEVLGSEGLSSTSLGTPSCPTCSWRRTVGHRRLGWSRTSAS